MSQIQLRDSGGIGIARINVRIAPGHGTSDQADADVFTDLVGNSGWPPFPGWPIRDWTLWINDRNVDPHFQSTSMYVEQPADGNYPDVRVILPWADRPVPPEPISTLLPLQRDGTDIRTSDGRRYVHNQATNYLLAQRHFEGQDITPLLYDGFDGYNVTFCMSVVPKQAGLPEFRPENYPHFYEQADGFFQKMLAAQKRIEATLLCDCDVMRLDEAWQRRHTDQMYEILRPYPNLVQLGNEVKKNGVAYDRLSQPAGLFWSRGSSLAGEQCPLPAGDYSTAHLSRQGGGAYLDAQSFYMIEGYAGYAGTHGPCIVNETRGASNTENSDRRTTDPSYFRKIASAMRGWNGGTFHADFAIHSEPCEPGMPQDACRLAFLEGMGR